MIIQYNIVVTVVNVTDNSTSKFNKIQAVELVATDDLLYNNYHVLHKSTHILDMFEDEVNAYCKALGIEQSSVEVDEFEIVSLTDRVDVFFEATEDNELSLSPVIKCYVYPKNDALKVPELQGVAYDSTTIIWSWPNDEEFAHYLVEEAINPDNEADKSKIIAQLPIGATSYTETGLTPNTAYTRRLINYTDEQVSIPSASVTVMTETVEAVQSLEEYSIPKNYDFTTNDDERKVIQENLEAFHSGIGDDFDLKVYKQMDADFYQKFKAYFEITGRRFQREKRYEQTGFNYKICLEAMETIEEQEGEVTFDIDVYPREWVTIEDYMWATLPITIKAKMKATIFLRKTIEEEEKVEIELWKPTGHWYQPTKWVPGSTKKTAVVIAVDLSSSMDYASGNQKKTTPEASRRVNKCKNAAKALVDAFDTFTDEEGHGFEDIEYIIVGWATRAYAKKYSNATAAKAGIDTMKTGHPNGGYFEGVALGDCTNFQGGLEAGRSLCAADREVIGKIFFTDGFCNMNNAGNYANEDTDANHSAVINGIATGMTSFNGKIYGVFGQSVNDKDPDYSGAASKYTKHNEAVVKKFINGAGYAGHKECKIDELNEEALAAELIGGMKMFTEGELVNDGPPIWIFDGYEKYTTEEIAKYDLDKVKAVEVESELYSFEFNNIVTPSRYERKEKRAIIPESSMIPSFTQKLATKSVYDILLDAAKATAEWAEGYNQTIGTTDGRYLIKGLFIQDSYNFADEDEITEANWGAATLEDGMEGTVNVYTDIDKAGTTTYGDDCYLVSQSNHLYIDGYTDAIIYDGERFATAELNYYDHPSEILVSASDDYNNLLFNRKKPTLNYVTAGGTGPLSHVIDIIQKDKDIFLTGYDGLTKQGDWLLIDPLTNDLVAHNETMFESPILNYRFNLEDPDAKTPIYEILPTCDPDSNYLHIVILHVYYAKNVWITDESNYVEQFGDDPIATTSSDYIPLVENVYKWTLKEWKDGYGKDNGWYIDNYLWFMAKPMFKTQEYYDELPGEGMETFYGLVNGRYRTDNPSGKKDLIVDTPQFNIPTTVHKDTIRIYIIITEFYPESSLVHYKWENPWNNKDSITQVNGDYVTFASDSITYKDVEYLDVISTINMENQEVFDNKTNEKIFELEQPETVYVYDNYYLEVHTDNSDVLAMRYPTEIVFDEEGKTQIAVSFKGVVNATSQWAPRIHNGYYYLNQHEYFAYCEFDVEANFDTIEERNFKTGVGYVSIDVQLRHKAKAPESYSIIKDTRAELLQNEEEFQWVDGKGLTLKPIIEGEYYRKYLSYMYYSPIIMFENPLTTAGPLTVDYMFEDGSSFLPMEIRHYILDEGKWSDWEPFTNGTAPLALSSAYQVRFTLQASVQDQDLFLEDYMCCYLDWKDDMDAANTTNIVTITDHMMAGPDEGDGIYISRIIDYGCESTIMLDMFDSKYKDSVRLYIAYSNTEESLLLENVRWTDITVAKDAPFTARYFRYKIVIPYGEKLYWLHKRIQTLETHELLPYVTGIKMTGEYAPTDVVTNFINTEAFEIPKDGEYHRVFNRLLDVIGADVLSKGYTEDEIEYVTIQCTTPDITLDFNKNVLNQYPGAALNTPIDAMGTIDFEVVVKNTPYIFAEEDYHGNEVVIIKGTPQQFCPITVEDEFGNSYTELFESIDIDWTCGPTCTCGCFLTCKEEYTMNEVEKYITLRRNDYEEATFKVYLNEVELTPDQYKRVNHLLIFNDFLSIGDTIRITYNVPHSFFADIDRSTNTTTLYMYSDAETKKQPISYNELIPYEGLSLYQMFLMGKRFSCYQNSESMNYSPAEEAAWDYDRDKATFITSVNSNYFNGFINNDTLVAAYTHEVTVKSDDADNDLNGVVVGYAYDSENKPHTLSFIVTRGGITGGEVALVYDYGRSSVAILKTFSGADVFPSFNSNDGWSKFPNGIRLRVEKNLNMITCQTSMWNDPDTWNPATLFTFDLDSQENTMIFSKGVNYGYCNHSQKNSYYQDIAFEAFIVKERIKKYKVYFETSTRNNKFTAKELSLNPIYRTDYKGFIYLTDEHNDPYKVNIYCNPLRLRAGGYDKVDVAIEVLDIMDNPIISKDVAIDCKYGILTCEDYVTDMNGVVHLVYESAYNKCTDTLTARVLTDDGSVIEQSISIINE